MSKLTLSFKLCVVCAMFLSLTANTCRREPAERQPEEIQKAEFEGFGVTPRICTNFGMPIMRLSWRVKGTGNTCLTGLKLNEDLVPGSVWNAGSDSVCGEDNYSREVAFSLQTLFGNNIPSRIVVDANLSGPVEGGLQPFNRTLDTGTATANALECVFSPL